MPKFRFMRPVLDADGYQSFTVNARNIEEAKTKIGEAEFECDESEVTALGEPDGWEECQ